MVYKLSATLAAHQSDVRAVVSPLDNLVLSASRDTTAIAWHRPSPEAEFTTASIFRANTRYVNSVTYLPPTQEATQGFLVAGGQDTTINVFSLASASTAPVHALLGHRDNVCALDATPNGTIISGSWDRTARVWKSFQSAFELQGHSQAVWAVLAIDDDQFLTGSADKTIKLWHTSKNLHTYIGHADAVRGLVRVPDIGFASCSNDSEIRVWTTGGDLVYTLSGHTSFVYSLAMLPTGEIVSGGEDRSVRVWRDGECVQTIVHPAISVWTVSAMPNGDIVSGCSDNIVRVFSASEGRWAKEAELKAYEDKVASQTLAAQQVGDVKKSDLPGLEALAQPGKKEGQVVMVQNGNVTEAHQWDSSSSSWKKIGEVVDAVGSNRKQLYNGKEYDFVFDVDIKEGAPPLKLPYNMSDNAFEVAQRFIANNDLPPSYLDQIVEFIDRNARGAPQSTPVASADEYVDPWTGASRHRPSVAAPPRGDLNSFVDPYTGASRYVASNALPTPAPAQPKVLPVRTPLSFKQANIPAMRGKIYQLNETLLSEISTSGLSLSPQEIKSLDHTFAKLAVVATTDTTTSTNIEYKNLDVVLQIIARWPESERYPLLDLTRLITAYFQPAITSPGATVSFLHTLLKAADWPEPWTVPLTKPRETNVLLALRAFANALYHVKVRHEEWVLELLQELTKIPYLALVKTHRVALATIVFNISCLSGVDDRIRSPHFDLIVKILKTETQEAETVYRTLVALGNCISQSKTGQLKIKDIPVLVNNISSKFPEQRIKSLASEIIVLTTEKISTL